HPLTPTFGKTYTCPHRRSQHAQPPPTFEARLLRVRLSRVRGFSATAVGRCTNGFSRTESARLQSAPFHAPRDQRDFSVHERRAVARRHLRLQTRTAKARRPRRSGKLC